MNNSAQKNETTQPESRFETVLALRNLDFGPVFLAYDLKTQASLRSLRVHIQLSKVPHDLIHGDSELALFNQNIATLRELEHPRLLRIFESITDNSCELLSLEHIEAVPLSALLGRCTLTVSEIVAILLETATALEALHKIGVVPFGLFPERILVQRCGSVKIDPIGVGLLKNVSVDRFKGIPHRYLAPECTDELTKYSDQFALGVIGAELLLGRSLVPERGLISRKINELWSAARFRLRRTARPTDALLEVVSTLQSKDPADRFPEISDAKHALAWIEAEIRKEPPAISKVFDNLLSALNKTRFEGISKGLVSSHNSAPETHVVPLKSAETGSLVESQRPTANATVFVLMVAIYLLGGIALLSCYLIVVG